jgi:hypothetical protein
VVFGRALLSEVTEQSDRLERLRREMHSLLEEREYILATACLPLSHRFIPPTAQRPTGRRELKCSVRWVSVAKSRSNKK